MRRYSTHHPPTSHKVPLGMPCTPGIAVTKLFMSIVWGTMCMQCTAYSTCLYGRGHVVDMTSWLSSATNAPIRARLEYLVHGVVGSTTSNAIVVWQPQGIGAVACAHLMKSCVVRRQTWQYRGAPLAWHHCSAIQNWANIHD